MAHNIAIAFRHHQKLDGEQSMRMKSLTVEVHSLAVDAQRGRVLRLSLPHYIGSPITRSTEARTKSGKQSIVIRLASWQPPRWHRGNRPARGSTNAGSEPRPRGPLCNRGPTQLTRCVAEVLEDPWVIAVHP